MTDRLLHKVDRSEVRNYLKSLTFPRPLRNYDDFIQIAVSVLTIGRLLLLYPR